MIKHWILLFQILILPFVLTAQKVNITGEAPNVVKVGERFQVVYKVDAKTDAPHIKLPDALTVLSGPGVSQSTSIQIINGKRSTSFNLTFTYIMVADQEGEFTIPPASVEKNQQTAKSNPVTIEVIKGSDPANKQK